jgi:cell division protein FtsQ
VPSALRARLRLALLAVAGAGLLAGGYLALRASPLFGVDRVTVIGATGSGAAEIRARVDAAIGSESLLAVDPQAVADAVAGLPLVRSVHVDRAFPHELRVRVVAERAAAIVETGTSRYTIARSGRVMGDAPASSHLPQLSASAAAVPQPGRALPPSTRDQVRLAAALLDHSDLRVTLIADDQSGLSARLAGGTQLRLGDATVLDRKLVVAAALLAKRPLGSDGEPISLKYLDVSVPDHPVLQGEQLDPHTAADGEPVDLGSELAPDVPVDVGLVISQLFRPAQLSTGG